jgi:hypothetical protein
MNGNNGYVESDDRIQARWKLMQERAQRIAEQKQAEQSATVSREE